MSAQYDAAVPLAAYGSVGERAPEFPDKLYLVLRSFNVGQCSRRVGWMPLGFRIPVTAPRRLRGALGKTSTLVSPHAS
jgi:hypothetical protein